jgi:hypothetical protein
MSKIYRISKYSASHVFSNSFPENKKLCLLTTGTTAEKDHAKTRSDCTPHFVPSDYLRFEVLKAVNIWIVFCGL